MTKDDLDHLKESLLKHKVITRSQLKSSSLQELFDEILPEKMNWGALEVFGLFTT